MQIVWAILLLLGNFVFTFRAVHNYTSINANNQTVQIKGCKDLNAMHFLPCRKCKVGNAFGCVKMPKTHLKPLSAASLFTRGHHTSISKCFIYLCRIPFLTHTQRVCLLLRLNQESFANLNMFLVLSKKPPQGAF